LKCFDFSQNFHGLLLSLQKKIDMNIFVNQSQESLEKSSWISIAMLWPTPRKLYTMIFHRTLLRNKQTQATVVYTIATKSTWWASAERDKIWVNDLQVHKMKTTA
jgi:hypothetical protein